MKDLESEDVQEFVNMLMGGDLPDGWELSHQPKLSLEEAFGVVYYLQEEMHLIPERFELCCVCDRIYDTDCQGHTIDATDNIDEWHCELGLGEQDLTDHDGQRFCSEECEIKFWRDKERSASGKSEQAE